ncbi:hypothetical protein BDB00DRAFT_816184 [Zychaea mexicana]|uniref:uncharacterized protein n=1 Tax=Zychaea mexicana TaxID=64656 RepID=UPI0022FE9553|nr:uncharacterized protein BDB00DRAFT_816184 [Zychaea mexicana]KAI9494876.1 hypothetical protein BDB00DRAFT_816184 [Zychaea mexicana]
MQSPKNITGKRKRLGTDTTSTSNCIASAVDDRRRSSAAASTTSDSSTSTTFTIDDNHDPTALRKPTCSICIQPYIRRTFLQPCYHSFCFQCIRQWINIVPNCPLCKQLVDSLVYNMDETTKTFQEYSLAANAASDSPHDPSPEPPPTTLQDSVLPLRRQMYLHPRSFSRVIYPPVLNRFAGVHYITPEHIPKVSTFLAREIPAIMGKTSDTFTERHIQAVLLTPYEANKQQQQRKSTSTRSSSSSTNSRSFSFSNTRSNASTATTSNSSSQMMSMYDPNVIQELGEWLTIGAKDVDGAIVARRFIDEVMAFIKSGMDYWTYVATAKYEE